MFFGFKIMIGFLKWSFLLAILAFVYQMDLHASNIGEKDFNDAGLTDEVVIPDWFKLSFLDLKEDILEAQEAGKIGLILYFGQSKCPYCKALVEDNFSKKDIVSYIQNKFDIVAIDVLGGRSVNSTSGEVMSEKQFAIRSKANFTPTLIFYNHSGNEVHRLVGYHSPYVLRAALEYVADLHYARETFSQYLARADVLPSERSKSKINYRSFSMKPPYMLARQKIHAQRPLLVIYEQANCHACDVLHAGAFDEQSFIKQLGQFDVVQLDMWGDTPIITPGGKAMTSKRWAEVQDIFYSPTLLFFDEKGSEVLRLGSVAHFNRLSNIFKYMTRKAYKTFKNYADWRENR